MLWCVGMIAQRERGRLRRAAGVSPGQAWDGSDLHIPRLLASISPFPPGRSAGRKQPVGGAEGVEAVTVIPTVAVVIAGTFPEDRCVPGTEPSPFSPPPQLQERGMEKWGVLRQHLGL